MSDNPIGINFTGNAAAATPEVVSAVAAVAEAARAWAQTLAQFAPSLQGTPGITHSTISGCSVNMGAPVVDKINKPRRRTRKARAASIPTTARFARRSRN